MDSTIQFFLLGLSIGFLLLLIEYLIIQPFRKKRDLNNLQLFDRYSYPSLNEVYRKNVVNNQSSRTFLNMFFLLRIGILSCLGSIATSVLIRNLAFFYSVGSYGNIVPPTADIYSLSFIAYVIGTSDYLFTVLLLISFMGGVALTYYIDNYLAESNTAIWIRLILPFLFGIIGGFLAVSLILVIIILLFSYLLLKSLGGQRGTKGVRGE